MMLFILDIIYVLYIAIISVANAVCIYLEKIHRKDYCPRGKSDTFWDIFIIHSDEEMGDLDMAAARAQGQVPQEQRFIGHNPFLDVSP